MAASLSSFHYSNPGRHGCGPPGPKGPRHCPPPTATSGSRSCRAGTDRCQRTVRAKSTEGVVVSTVEAVTGAGPLDAGACAGPEVAMPFVEVGAVTVAQPHEVNRTPDTPALKVTGTPARATPWPSVTLAASGLRAAPALTRWGVPDDAVRDSAVGMAVAPTTTTGVGMAWVVRLQSFCRASTLRPLTTTDGAADDG